MKKLLLGCGLFLLLLVGAAVFAISSLPDSFLVERELEMKGTPEQAYAAVADLHTWPEWTVWNKEMDPSATWEFKGSEVGNGAVWSWTGEELGNGELTLRDCQSPSSISYDLVMDGGEVSSSGKITIEPTTPGMILVHWENGGELAGIWKLIGPLTDGMIGPMYETGLKGLATRIAAVK